MLCRCLAQLLFVVLSFSSLSPLFADDSDGDDFSDCKHNFVRKGAVSSAVLIEKALEALSKDMSEQRYPKVLARQGQLLAAFGDVLHRLDLIALNPEEDIDRRVRSIELIEFIATQRQIRHDVSAYIEEIERIADLMSEKDEVFESFSQDAEGYSPYADDDDADDDEPWAASLGNTPYQRVEAKWHKEREAQEDAAEDAESDAMEEKDIAQKQFFLNAMRMVMAISGPSDSIKESLKKVLSTHADLHYLANVSLPEELHFYKTEEGSDSFGFALLYMALPIYLQICDEHDARDVVNTITAARTKWDPKRHAEMLDRSQRFFPPGWVSITTAAATWAPELGLTHDRLFYDLAVESLRYLTAEKDYNRFSSDPRDKMIATLMVFVHKHDDDADTVLTRSLQQFTNRQVYPRLSAVNVSVAEIMLDTFRMHLGQRDPRFRKIDAEVYYAYLQSVVDRYNEVKTSDASYSMLLQNHWLAMLKDCHKLQMVSPRETLKLFFKLRGEVPNVLRPKFDTEANKIKSRLGDPLDLDEIYPIE